MIRARSLFCGTALLVVSTLQFCSCAKRAAEDAGADAEPAAPVQVETAAAKTIHRTVTAEAVIYPVRQADIVPKISAPVERFLVQRGDHVRPGQLVAVLEHRDLAAAAMESHETYVQAEASYAATTAATAPEDLEKAKGDAAAARSALDAAKRVFDSRVSLYQQGAIPKKSLDDAQVALVQAQAQADLATQHLSLLEKVGQSAQMKSAQAQMEAAKAHYDSVAAQSRYAEIRSPITGIVSDRAANVGGMAASGSPLITVVDLSEVTARTNLPVADAIDIQSGQKATINVAGRSVPGVVRVVSPTVDPNTTTLEIWVVAKNPGERLKPGLTATVVIQAGAIPNAVVVPRAALLSSEEGGDKVMLAGSDQLAHETPVKIGARDGDDVQILEGVKAGDQVIVSGALGLDDKAKITLSKGEGGEKGGTE